MYSLSDLPLIPFVEDEDMKELIKMYFEEEWMRKID